MNEVNSFNTGCFKSFTKSNLINRVFQKLHKKQFDLQGVLKVSQKAI